MSEVNALALPPSIRNKLLQSGPATTSSLAHQVPSAIANGAFAWHDVIYCIAAPCMPLKWPMTLATGPEREYC